jgi:hypothetical protein
VYSSPAIGADGTVYVGSYDTKVYALDGATGQKRWEFTTGDWVYSSPAIGADGTVYVGSDDNKVYALYTGSVGGLAQSPWPKFRGDARNTGRAPDQPPRFGRQPSVRFFREGGEGRLTVQVSGAPMPTEPAAGRGLPAQPLGWQHHGEKPGEVERLRRPGDVLCSFR